jgi:hypothetical protein
MRVSTQRSSLVSRPQHINFRIFYSGPITGSQETAWFAMAFPTVAGQLTGATALVFVPRWIQQPGFSVVADFGISVYRLGGSDWSSATRVDADGTVLYRMFQSYTSLPEAHLRLRLHEAGGNFSLTAENPIPLIFAHGLSITRGPCPIPDVTTCHLSLSQSVSDSSITFEFAHDGSNMPRAPPAPPSPPPPPSVMN